MLQRRSFVVGLSGAIIGPGAWAQRAMHPIARPPGVGSGRVPGSFATGATPGIYVVDSVDTQADTLQLRDDTGRTGTVHVSERAFDLSTLRPGDEVQVDFLVPEPGNARLEAGNMWKVER